MELLIIYIIFVALALMIAKSRDVDYGAGFVIVTLLIPLAGIIWAVAAQGGKKYKTWDAKDISDASYEDTKKCISHLATEKLKEFALKEVKRKEASEPKTGYDPDEFDK